MTKKLTDAKRQKIISLFATGKSCRAIAKELGHSPDTVSRIAKAEGHKFGHSNAANAREARKWYCAESRAAIAAKVEEEVQLLLEELHKPHIAFNFGGKENDYNEHHFDEPPTETKFTIMRAVQSGIRTVTDIVKVDNSPDENVKDRIGEFDKSLDPQMADIWAEEQCKE